MIVRSFVETLFISDGNGEKGERRQGKEGQGKFVASILRTFVKSLLTPFK